MTTKGRGKRILAVLLAIIVAALVIDNGLSEDCSHPFILNRRECILLRTPLIWVAPDRTVTWNQPESITAVAVPDGVVATSLKGDTAEEHRDAASVAQNHKGGFVSLIGTWSEQASDDNTLYVIDEGTPFIGQFMLGSFEPKPRAYSISCLVDFVQLPCTPGAVSAQTITLSERELVRIPVEINGLEQGLHDLTILIDRDLANDRENPQAESRWRDIVMALRASIAVNGETAPISREFQRLPLPLYSTGSDGIALSLNRIAWNKVGVPQQNPLLSAKRGETTKFFLYLSNNQPIRVDFAVSAFIDSVQIPINYHHKSYQPWYVSAKARAQYVLPVDIVAPSEAGHYELVFYAQPFPQARMDINREVFSGSLTYGLGIDMWSSYRFYLDVQ